ncbi:uncharacterized protein LOC109598261 isoform X2 [Aethina tumida]|uniref:uncharacterized protein LOC109598261 isoform X2 n=1 Tax=Aethina tumida TaxID=116153 RepID=UPI002147BF2D|nr:uncharacterized protein LOC109598261 isoform X2 [Aethina tumida]
MGDVNMELIEKRLNEQEKTQFFNAIKDSEYTAMQEDQTRKNSQGSVEETDTETTVKETEPDVESTSNNTDAESSEQNDSDTQDVSSSAKIDERIKGFRESLDPDHPLLTTTKDNVKDLAMRLYNYHLERSRLLELEAIQKGTRAPLPKPIPASSLSEHINYSTDEGENTYVCRSGRQTKRKNYNEVLDTNGTDNATTKKPKPVKEDDEWMTKKSKAQAKPIKKSEQPSTSKKMDDTKENLNPKSEGRTYRKKMTNEEILSRSSLFSDSPKSSRNATILENAQVEVEKKKKEEDQMEQFDRSLNISEEEQTQTIEEAFQRVRLTPPLPIACRRPINYRKRRGGAGDGASSSTESHLTEINKNKGTNLRKNANRQQEAAVSTPVEMVTCPICTKDFHPDKIETHASSCGEEFVMDVAEPDRDERRKCDFCDKNFSLDADYEVHVKKCELQHKQPNK